MSGRTRPGLGLGPQKLTTSIGLLDLILTAIILMKFNCCSTLPPSSIFCTFSTGIPNSTPNSTRATRGSSTEQKSDAWPTYGFSPAAKLFAFSPAKQSSACTRFAFSLASDNRWVAFARHSIVEKTSSIGIIVDPVVAGIAVLALIGVAVAWKKKKKPTKEDHEQPGGRDVPETPQRSPKGLVVAYSPPNAGHETAGEKATSAAKGTEWHAARAVSSARTVDRTPMVPEAARRFTYNEILSITQNFGWVIGEGGSSTVYYGQLPETGVKVAVKKLKESGSQIGNLLKEIEILMRIHHRNLVSLVGFYVEQDEIMLVSEYMANGSLFERLKGMNSWQSEDTRANELTWRKRLQIALDAAIGLEYLHTGCKPAVIHRDIKPANILLDENLQAKLTDFGLSKAGAVDGTEPSAYQTRLAGTLGYIDPEYLQTETLTKKSDVYSFGVVLFELITGKPAMMITETNEKCNITRWVMPMLIRGNIESLLDPLLKGQCNVQSVWEVAAIARTAVQDPAGRPDMTRIVSTLKAALSMETSWVDMALVSKTMIRQSSLDEIPHNPVAR
ncbi:putative leucine-rich repeat receptor-like protein kinase [Nymphaea thermarum]|nr:putative leucine-rich repeat receptor-like protein kinase [Nymphaea thermarum]